MIESETLENLMRNRQDPSRIHPTRVRALNEKPYNDEGEFILYWMQTAMRSRHNLALDYAIEQANKRSLPVVVRFGLTPHYPEATMRHYAFLLQGLRDVLVGLTEQYITMVCHDVKDDQSWKYASELALKYKPVEVVVDMGYLRHLREWRTKLAEVAPMRVTQIEADACVPVEEVSNHCEFAARTIRPKIMSRLNVYLSSPPTLELKNTNRPSWADEENRAPEACDLRDWKTVLDRLDLKDRSVPVVDFWEGGENTAQQALEAFLQKMHQYDQTRNDPFVVGSSQLSMYLHFGHLSPIQAAVKAKAKSAVHSTAFIEEMVVRRELSFNHCWFETRYDRLECVPEWAHKTMAKHAADQRSHIYNLQQFEEGKTEDPIWNAAQREVVLTGRMSNYLRMYWGKKIIEWSKTYEDAWKVMAYLNNKYEIDGRDPNSWCNFAWCFGSKDRPWGERPVLGLLRTLTSSGIQKKFDMPRYIRRIAAIEKSGGQIPPSLGPMDSFIEKTAKKRPDACDGAQERKRRRSSHTELKTPL